MRCDDVVPSRLVARAGSAPRIKHAGPHRIVDVVVDVRNDVGHPGDLPFDRTRPGIRRRANRQSVFALGMPRDAVAHLPGQVQPLPTVFNHIHHTKTLLVVAEATGRKPIEHPFTGVPERWVAQVVAEGNRFRQLLVEPQHLGNAAGNLRDLQSVRQTGAVVVTSRGKEHLRLVLEPAERLRVDDPIAVALKHRTNRILRLWAQSPTA